MNRFVRVTLFLCRNKKLQRIVSHIYLIKAHINTNFNLNCINWEMALSAQFCFYKRNSFTKEIFLLHENLFIVSWFGSAFNYRYYESFLFLAYEIYMRTPKLVHLHRSYVILDILDTSFGIPYAIWWKVTYCFCCQR